MFRFIRPGGNRGAIPALQLHARIDLLAHVRSGETASDAAFPDCIIDTGCPISVIPEYVWGRFKPGVVTPLPFDPAMPTARRSVSMAGGNFPYELGELPVRLRDLAGGSLDLTVVAQLVRDQGRLATPVLLGLRGGALDGRDLRGEPDPSAPFGQSWHLGDP